MKHKVYGAIIKAITTGKLIEPFTKQDFQKHCPGLGAGTYNAFLPKHAKGNPGGNSELVERVGPGKFRCLHLPNIYPQFGGMSMDFIGRHWTNRQEKTRYF